MQDTEPGVLDINDSQLCCHLLTTFTFERNREGASIKVAGCREMLPAREMPDYITGLIDSDGDTIVVIDSKMQSGAGETPISPTACIILLEYEWKGKGCTIGILVDDISGIFDIVSNRMERFERDASAGEVGDTLDFDDLCEVLAGFEKIAAEVAEAVTGGFDLCSSKKILNNGWEDTEEIAPIKERNELYVDSASL